MTTKTIRDAGSGLHVTVEQLSPRDAVFVYDEFERHPSNIVAAYVFAGAADATGSEGRTVSRTEVRAWMRERLGYAPLFHRRLEHAPGDVDLPYWVPDPSVDIDRHVTIEERASWPWAQVRERLAEIAAARMDLTRPPWELHLFDRVHGFPGTTEPVRIVVLKFHHSVGDGVATRALEMRLFGAADTHPPLPTIDHRWSQRAALLRAAAVTPYRFARFVSGVARTRAAARTVRAAVADNLLREPIPLRPATRFNRRIGARPVFDLVTLPLTQVRAAKAAVAERITVNDLLLAVVSGALSAYLGEHGETPPESLSAMVPISMRGLAQWNSANQLCQMSVDLHTDLADPLERLRAIRQSTRDEKQRWADPAVIARESRMQTSPAWLLRLAGWARAQRDFDDADTVPLSNTTVSNVPPVADRLEFLGAPVISVFGVLPIMDGDGLRHLITSQGDQVVIAVSSDAGMLPDPARYGELLLRSFRELSEHLTTGG
ncbi:wax ester/triacylglycerol synthase family O-acyltransferase [Nocardia africana]|uniref:Diacylglycerol O-acyltransferase n=1 Tax=Nocardia africana TaxID=134964 RepID=A0A378WP79_9NOCA|nr:wax ester/triacylglycerol synthase family O-acyltransferase [Nocardia africana]MCC3315427.1 wax ester/triacylglycerol synthase family O-acyltransferase [Nocardia africana]SUA42261.1 Diacylglycerol O-acyltransferase [Nocardia africana]